MHVLALYSCPRQLYEQPPPAVRYSVVVMRTRQRERKTHREILTNRRYEDSEHEVKFLKHGELAVIPTTWGHIAGGGANDEDTKWMDERIEKFLKEEGTK